MTIKKFIETVIEGGYRFNLSKEDTIIRIDTDSVWEDGKAYIHFHNKETEMLLVNIHELLLYPKVWEAVGKTKDTIMQNQAASKGIYIASERWHWEDAMLGMIHNLIRGMTLEEYISTL